MTSDNSAAVHGISQKKSWAKLNFSASVSKSKAMETILGHGAKTLGDRRVSSFSLLILFFGVYHFLTHSHVFLYFITLASPSLYLR